MSVVSNYRSSHPTWHRHSLHILGLLFGGAVLVSIAHYADNYFNYADFPQSQSLPDPPRWLIGGSWFLFTAAGIAGFLLYRRQPSRLSLILLAVYSGSGLVGFGHYSALGASEMPWWRHAHVVADIVLGVAIFAFVIWALRQRRRVDDTADDPWARTRHTP